jgi:hypothetical protein
MSQSSSGDSEERRKQMTPHPIITSTLRTARQKKSNGAPYQIQHARGKNKKKTQAN